ncbi:MAG: polymerase, sigma-24 subunit, subfamily [Verrucomicrobia bacterium]|nr:polymerase, sigma-24 subunit, subfamily [Verrucomicrobiota bacterium]
MSPSSSAPSDATVAAPAAPGVAGTGDQSSWFTSEVYPHDASLKAYLRSRYPAVGDIDDVVQESYLRLWKATIARRVEYSKSFLFRIARNLAVDLLRRGQRSPVDRCTDRDVSFVLDDRPSAAEAAITHDEVCLLAKAIEALPEKCRRVMILRQIEGLPQREIAARLGLSEQTIQSHVVRGLRAIGDYLRAKGVRHP